MTPLRPGRLAACRSCCLPPAPRSQPPLYRLTPPSTGRAYNASTKLANDYDFFALLRDSGRRAARRFLEEHFDDIGVKSTVDLRAEVPAVKT